MVFLQSFIRNPHRYLSQLRTKEELLEYTEDRSHCQAMVVERLARYQIWFARLSQR